MNDCANLDGKSFVLAGPMTFPDCQRTPVRGDLAHIALAGRYFVPHYAVPQPHLVVAAGEHLLASDKPGSDAIATLVGGTLFNVLDVAGGYAWGQVGDDGLVGYLPLSALEERRD